MTTVTLILSQIESGDPSAAEQLLPLVYDELRALAATRMASERKDHTLQGTALVHEAYLRLVGSPASNDWLTRGHFFSAAAEAMRRILIDYARRRTADKRGGHLHRIPMDTIDASVMSPLDYPLEFDDALSRLAEIDSTSAKLVELRFFTGLSIEEAAQVLSISTRSAYRNWEFAKAWLYHELSKDR